MVVLLSQIPKYCHYKYCYMSGNSKSITCSYQQFLQIFINSLLYDVVTIMINSLMYTLNVVRRQMPW